MFTKLFSIKLGSKVMFGFLLSAILSIGLVAMISVNIADESLEQEAFNKLTAVREIKAAQIEDYFAQIRNQVETLSESRMIVNAMRLFKTSFHAINGEVDLSPKTSSSMDNRLRSTYSNEFLPRLNKNLLHLLA